MFGTKNLVLLFPSISYQTSVSRVIWETWRNRYRQNYSGNNSLETENEGKEWLLPLKILWVVFFSLKFNDRSLETVNTHIHMHACLRRLVHGEDWSQWTSIHLYNSWISLFHQKGIMLPYSTLVNSGSSIGHDFNLKWSSSYWYGKNAEENKVDWLDALFFFHSLSNERLK